LEESNKCKQELLLWAWDFELASMKNHRNARCQNCFNI